jgi:hypothetical protein
MPPRAQAFRNFMSRDPEWDLSLVFGKNRLIPSVSRSIGFFGAFIFGPSAYDDVQNEHQQGTEKQLIR